MWGSEIGHWKPHLLSWDVLCLPKIEGRDLDLKISG